MLRALFLTLAIATPALAGDGRPAALDTMFPTNFGGAYDLIDHHGNPRGQVDPDGNLQLIFFGYASCEAICTVALPIMSEMTEILAGRDVAVTPLVITVDPARDTVGSMGPALADFAPGLTGLTGTEAQLAHARALFHVERSALFEEPLGGTVYTHGSHIYVMDGAGRFLTVLPPILSTARMVDIVEGYAGS